MTALSLCNYLHVIVPSCLKVSITELRKTRCSFIQEEVSLSLAGHTNIGLHKVIYSFFTWVLLLCLFEQDIPCEDLRSKLSALLTVQPHIEAQTEINAQLMAEVEKYI